VIVIGTIGMAVVSTVQAYATLRKCREFVRRKFGGIDLISRFARC
jgi:hypothetical protein